MEHFQAQLSTCLTSSRINNQGHNFPAPVTSRGSAPHRFSGLEQGVVAFVSNPRKCCVPLCWGKKEGILVPLSQENSFSLFKKKIYLFLFN